MNLLMAVKPTNLLEEREKFFADVSYNPQFTYADIPAPELLTQWGVPHQGLYEYAYDMLQRFPAPGSTAISDRVSQEDIVSQVAAFNQRFPLHTPLEVHFDSNLVSRCKVTPTALYFQLPLVYSKEQLGDLLRHELETHVLRYRNHAAQAWSTYESPEHEIRRTEEGIANLHTHLLRQDKRFYKSFFSYVAAYTAQKASFAEVFDTLVRLGRSKQTSWNTAVKVKRGLTDTSQPGLFSREMCYLEGSIQVYDWLIHQKSNPHQLYWGRLSLEELRNFSTTVTSEQLSLPTFFLELDQYLNHISTIGSQNYFDDVVKEVCSH